MCGIVALLSPRQPIDPAVLERATERLYHRGPDGRRYWVAPHRRVGLGHARLSIIDLHTGDQPIANEDERLHIVVNGVLVRENGKFANELPGRVLTPERR